MRRGEVWWADIPEPTGSEPGFRRPVVIVQADMFTESQLRTVIVITLSSNLRLAQAPGNVLLNVKATRLPKASVANVSQMLTLNKTALSELAGILNATTMRSIDKGLRFVLDL